MCAGSSGGHGMLCRAIDGPFAWWDQMRPRFFAGSTVPARAGCGGNDLIAGHIIEFRAWREDLARLLEGLGDFLACVCCDLNQPRARPGYRRIGEVCPLSGASEEPGR